MRRPPTEVQEWLKSGSFLEYQDYKIFYKDSGNKNSEPIVFLHGYPTCSWDYVYLWEKFADYRRITLDFLGFGFSSNPRDHEYSINEQTELLLRLLRLLKIKKIKIVAHDYAVSVAQELLARELNSELDITLQSVVFLNGGLIPGAHRPRLIQTLLNSAIGPVLVQLMSKFSFQKSFSRVFGPETKPNLAEIDSLWYLLNYPGRSRNSDKMLHYMQERVQNKDRWVGALTATQIPLKLIDGIEDPVSGGHLVDAYERIVPNADTIRLPGIGHYPQIEAFDDVARIILSWRRGGYA